MIGVNNISENGIAFIKKEEGFRAVPYSDNRASGKCSVGYGTLTDCNSPNITKAEADHHMRVHLNYEVIPYMNQYLSGVQINQNQFDAICSLIYNVGYHAVFVKKYNNGYSSGSTIYNKLKNGDINGAGVAFNTTGWQNKNRRTRERDFFESKQTTSNAPTNFLTKNVEKLADKAGVSSNVVYAISGVLGLVLIILLFRKKQIQFPWTMY